MKKKYYAVQIGRKPGIYETWDECKEQTHKFEGAKFKSFESLEEAKAFVNNEVLLDNNNVKNKDIRKASHKNIQQDGMDLKKYDGLVAYVDGSYNAETNTSGYGMVIVKDGISIYEEYKSFANHKFNQFRNVFGEVTGCTKAVEYAIKNGYRSICIAYDYTGIKHWATGEWKRNNEMTDRYNIFMQKKMNEIDIYFKKIKAHASVEEGGDKFNEYADELAKKSVGIL
jgi:ribonuclease HI